MRSRYWEDAAAAFVALSSQASDPLEALSHHPDVFRAAPIADTRMCMCSFMAAKFDELPELVRTDVRKFADVNVAWLATTLPAAGVVDAGAGVSRGRAIHAAIAGYREAGLPPA